MSDKEQSELGERNESQADSSGGESRKPKTSRRKFFVRAGLGSMGVVALGTYVFRNPIRRAVFEVAESTVPPYSGKGTEANLWFEITNDNRVLVHSSKVEMGQGTFTGFAQMVSDELDVSIDQIQVVAAASDTGIVDAMSTGGSFSIASLWQPLRKMAATMREMLKEEAARQWGVVGSSLTTKNGVVSGGGKSSTYAEIAADVTEWRIPRAPKLRGTSQYNSIGKPVPRIDLVEKVFGEPIFGMDAELPGMLHASVIRPEHIGAKFKSADTAVAERMPGVVKVIQRADWVAVVAETLAQALAAKREIQVSWDIPRKWNETELRELLQVGKGSEMVTQKVGTPLVPGDDGVETLEFTSPIGAHAQIEPNGAVAHVVDGKATVILSTQVVGITQKMVADALGFPLENVNIVPTFLGGGFGRRLNTSHAVHAAEMSREVGKPVKYFFTRKEEFQHDLFRPPTHHVMRGKVGADSYLDSLEHHYASGDVAVNSVLLPGIAHSILGADFGAMRGANLMYEGVPNHRSVQWHTTLPFATSWWRSLGLLANTFAIESFVDEMALKHGKDPVDFRIQRLGNSLTAGRIKAVIEKVAQAAGYQDKPTNGRAMGLAASIDSNSPCAQVAEVSVEGTTIVVHKVTCAFDCGLAVNPDQVKAQCEGNIIMGMSAAMHERMSLKDGRLSPTIYGPYDMALLRHAPKDIDVHLIQGMDEPQPVGEPPMGPIGAAIGNAVRRLTNQRLVDLPMKISS